MSWPASIFIALLTAILGLFVAGVVAALCVDWYQIPSREGGSGYFVVFLALLGFVAGLVIGLIASRVVAGGAHPGFLRGLGMSFGVVIAIVALSAGLARALADVPPTIGGERLLLAVEIRWPAGQTAAPVSVGADEPSIGLHSIPHFSHTVRASEQGPLWMEDAHQVDGRWVVPGAVEVFTSRGTRMMSVNTGDKSTQGFQVPLSAFPGRKSLEWSGWLPTFRPGVVVPPSLLSFRYRVVKISDPIRTETLGPFEISTVATSFWQVQQDQQTLRAANATFRFSYRGKPLVVEGKIDPAGEATERFDVIDDVALVPGPRPAFLIHVEPPTTSSYFYLVVDEGDRVRIDYVAQGSSGTKGQLLTSDTALFRAAARIKPVRGRIDRVSYRQPGLYRMGFAEVDTRVPAVRYFEADSAVSDIPSVPPLGLSPDERSFVTYGSESGSSPPPLLLVTDVVADTTYTLPIDPKRMHYATFEALDPAWLDHHFVWRRQDGVDRLVERAHIVPLPWRGAMSVDGEGRSTYRLDKGTEALRGALLDFLVSQFKAERQAADSTAYEIPVLIGGRTVNVAYSSSSDFGYVSVSMDRSAMEDPALMADIAKRFDAVLATGKHDALFGQ